MIVLWLLVAHLSGDYLIQTRWQATGKFGWTDDAYWLRARHVAGYTGAFIPAAIIYGWRTGDAQGAGTVAFLVLLAIAHFLTDAQRFTRTPGEWLWWRIWRRFTVQGRTDSSGAPAFRLTSNPWPPIGLAIDQTLHLIQIAVLAAIFLT